MARVAPTTGAILCVLLVAGAPAARAELPVPQLTGPVVDLAGLVDGRSARALESLARGARAAEGGQGVQLQYLIVPSLEGEPIESFAIRVAEAWKIGSRGRDNGVLVVVARDDRAVRIEVGGGLEGGLTDLQASRIIRNVIAPAFRAGAFGQGLHDAGVQILGALGALPQGSGGGRAVARPAPRIGATSVVLGLFLLLFLFRILGSLGPRRSVLGRRRRSGLWWGGPFLGGGLGGGWGRGGGWGGGGGGWGGGGGGFSGGGASGRW